MKHIELWHGGRELEYSYSEFGGTKKGRWEYGPGLYLTTHYMRARDYAKGGGSTYRVQIEEGQELQKILVDITDVNDFVSKYIIKNKQKRILESLYDNLQRGNSSSQIKLEILVNLIINDEAISNTKTKILNSYLVEKGADYSIVKRYGGREETVLVLFNRAKIKSVKKIKSDLVLPNEYEINFSFQEIESKKTILNNF